MSLFNRSPPEERIPSPGKRPAAARRARRPDHPRADHRRRRHRGAAEGQQRPVDKLNRDEAGDPQRGHHPRRGRRPADVPDPRLGPPLRRDQGEQPGAQEGRPGAVGHDDAAAPGSRRGGHHDPVAAARPQGRDPRLRHRQAQRVLLLRRPDADGQDDQGVHGLDINHIININFGGFREVINAIGCVYVDVDRRYYHSNEGLPLSAHYAEIDIDPGYQKLCGTDALNYVRFRHADSDIVRAARQQAFLRQAKDQLNASSLIGKRDKLLDIFGGQHPGRQVAEVDERRSSACSSSRCSRPATRSARSSSRPPTTRPT